jgi:hypothetical protein
LGKNSIPLIAQSAYEKFTTKEKNRSASTFFMGYAFSFGISTAYVLLLGDEADFQNPPRRIDAR